eukprot:gene13625-19502_t
MLIPLLGFCCDLLGSLPKLQESSSGTSNADDLCLIQCMSFATGVLSCNPYKGKDSGGRKLGDTDQNCLCSPAMAALYDLGMGISSWMVKNAGSSRSISRSELRAGLRSGLWSGFRSGRRSGRRSGLRWNFIDLVTLLEPVGSDLVHQVHGWAHVLNVEKWVESVTDQNLVVQDVPAKQLAHDVGQVLSAFWSQERLSSLCINLIGGLFVLRAKDLEEWKSSPEEYYHHCCTSGGMERAIVLLASPVLSSTRRLCNRVVGIPSPVLHKEAVYHAMAECCNRVVGIPSPVLHKEAIYNAVAVGAYELHDYLDWSSFLRSTLLTLAAVEALHALVDDWNFSETQFVEFVFNLMNVVIERLGESILSYAEAIIQMLPQLWSDAEGQPLVRIQVLLVLQRLINVLGPKSVLLALQRLINVLGPNSVGCYPLLLPLIKHSVNPGEPESLSLAEDGLCLWLVATRNATHGSTGNTAESAGGASEGPLSALGPLSPAVQQLLAPFPLLAALMASSTEHIRVGLQLLGSLTLLGGAMFVQTYSKEFATLFELYMGYVNEKGMLLVFNAMDALLTVAPQHLLTISNKLQQPPPPTPMQELATLFELYTGNVDKKGMLLVFNAMDMMLTELATLFELYMGNVNEKGMLLVFNAMDTLLTVAPQQAAHVLTPTCIKLLLLLMEGKESPLTNASGNVVFARILLQTPNVFMDIFVQCIAQGAQPPQAAAVPPTTAAPELLLHHFLEKWMDSFDGVAQPASRKLAALAQCCLLTLPSSVVLLHFDSIVANVTGVWHEQDNRGTLDGHGDSGAAGWGDDDGNDNVLGADLASEDAKAECDRRQMGDPVTSLHLRSVLQERMGQAAALHGAAFQSAANMLDATIAAQLKTVLGVQ